MRVITGEARGMTLKTPAGLTTRPTAERVKEALFSAIQFEIEGRAVLDLFAGSGQLGIEALSRGASSAVFVDQEPDAIRSVRENLRRTGLEQRAQVVQTDYAAFLRSAPRFDLIFLDPPYGEKFLEKALNLISEIDILRNRGIIVCEKPLEKTLEASYGALVLQKEYRYGKTSVALFRKG